MIDSKKYLEKFGEVLRTSIKAAEPKLTDVNARQISHLFPAPFCLYDHQLKAIEAIHAGKNILVSSGTNSGKTEAAFLSLVDSLKKGASCQALFVYPNKALTADQKLRLDKYSKPYSLSVCVFDADNHARFKEINECEIVLTNPAMLLEQLKNSDSILSKRLTNLRFVVLDEIHFYTAYQINILLAIMKFIQDCITDNFQLILLSATVGNPNDIKKSLAELFKRESEVICGRAKHPLTNVYLFSSINPRYLYRSYLPENDIASLLAEKYAYDEVSTLIFNDTRRDAAMIGEKAHHKVGDLVAIHYGSMEKDERSKSQEDFRNGKTKVMVTVKTLQQGIDIGSVQRILHVGLPERQSDFWQRQGRMGRRESIGCCESIVLPSPRVAFDMFAVSSKERFEDFLSKRIEKVLLKCDSKIIKMFLGCMKIKSGLELAPEDVRFLKATRLIEPLTSLTSFQDNASSKITYTLTRTGEHFLSGIRFYTGKTVKVLNSCGREVKIGNTTLTELQPNSIIFNNDIRHPEFYVVKKLDTHNMEATVEPITEIFDIDTCEKIRKWKVFSRVGIDFSMTNPDSTFGNIILKPTLVQHVEYVVKKSGGKTKRGLEVLEEFKDVQGQEELLSNYVLSDLPEAFLKRLGKKVKDPLLTYLVIDAAFSCIRNGLRSKLDIAYDEFSHIINPSKTDDGITPKSFIFYETSCSDVIKDVNWSLVKESAKEFLEFVQGRDEAGLFYLRGSRSYFRIINDLKKDLKKELYKCIEDAVDILAQLIIEKLELSMKVGENEEYCVSIGHQHDYVFRLAHSFDELLTSYPQLCAISNNLVVFFVDDYIESGYKLQNLTIAASRSTKIEERYVMFVSIPALIELTDSAILTVVLHELRHLQNIQEGRPFENQIEEEASVCEAVDRLSKKSKKIKEGLCELADYLEKIQTVTHMYSMDELLTIGGRILENLRWQKARRTKFIHAFKTSQAYGYHELKNIKLSATLNVP